MDELTIDDKKYVSSKRAAQITGYAKDYIGQLCREGRVPARLVGRNWYVLESAIADHRFGPPKSAPEPVHAVQEVAKEPERTAAWEAPRYEAVVPDPLPVHQEAEPAPVSPDISYTEPTQPEETEEQPEALMDSWRNWFDQIAEIAPEGKKSDKAPAIEAQARSEETKVSDEAPADTGDVPIPIRTVYPISTQNTHHAPTLPPRELMPSERAWESPQKASGEEYDEEEVRFYEEPVHQKTSTIKRVGFATVQLVSVFVAVVAASIAAISTGYFDTYIASVSQASVVTGISEYEK